MCPPSTGPTIRDQRLAVMFHLLLMLLTFSIGDSGVTGVSSLAAITRGIR